MSVQSGGRKLLNVNGVGDLGGGRAEGRVALQDIQMGVSCGPAAEASPIGVMVWTLKNDSLTKDKKAAGFPVTTPHP